MIERITESMATQNRIFPPPVNPAKNTRKNSKYSSKTIVIFQYKLSYKTTAVFHLKRLRKKAPLPSSIIELYNLSICFTSLKTLVVLELEASRKRAVKFPVSIN